MRCLLALRDARLFLAGQSLSLLGDTALWLALGLWAKDLTGSSSAAGLVILCIVAPQLASPVAGLLVDRVRRRTVLLVVNPLTALAVLPLLAVHSERDVWIIYAVAFAYGTSSVVLAAGQSALLHTLVPAELLGTANAALQTVREALRLITPLAGAGLYTLAGGAAVALLDAATFLAATAALLALKVREPKPERDPEPRAIAAGARHVAKSTDLRAMVLGCALCRSSSRARSCSASACPGSSSRCSRCCSGARRRTCRAGRSRRPSWRWARRRRCQSPSGRHLSLLWTIALYSWSKP